MIGKTISHYKILEKLGEGGMGVVYKAEDTKLERLVAIKFLPHHIAANAEKRERFKIEAKAAAALNHPNIATIYAIEEVDGEMFIVMEFIDGKELRKLLIDNGQLSIDNCLNYAAQIAEGLQAAHAKGVTHRDIKSSNIMVTESGQIKIMDFGLAKIAGSAQLTKDHSTLGTAAYMSPEQARGEPVDHRTDIWSFGVVLYEMLTGQLPFRGVYEAAMMYSILNEEPEPLIPTGSGRMGVPMELERIVAKALAKKSVERYQQVDEMLVDLKSITKSPESRQTGTVKEKIPKRRRILLYGVVAAFLILLIASGLYLLPTRSEAINSIAVLPLANLSGDPNQEFFADGMTEALISVLGQIEALRVISRTSVMQYKNIAKPLPAIAKELNVKAIVEGAVQPSGSHVAISVRLIEAATEKRLWSGNFERELRDVLTLQRETALAIAREINARVTVEERARLGEARTVDPEAYELYLWGQKYWDQETLGSVRQAIDYFERALVIDPDFAPAHANLAVPYFMSSILGLLSPEEAKHKATKAATTALKLDNTVAEAHTAMGVITEFYDWDWEGAGHEFRRAIALNPSNREAHREYGLLLCRTGRTEEGLAEIKRAAELDPLSEAANAYLAWAYIYNRRYDEAIKQCQKVIALNSSSAWAHLYLGEAYLHKGMYSEAIATLETNEAASLGSVQTAFIGFAHASSGDREKALRTLKDLQQSDTEVIVAAIIYTGLAEKDEALTRLEQACDERVTAAVHFILNPVFEPLHAEPRFQALLRKARLK